MPDTNEHEIVIMYESEDEDAYLYKIDDWMCWAQLSKHAFERALQEDAKRWSAHPMRKHPHESR